MSEELDNFIHLLYRRQKQDDYKRWKRNMKEYNKQLDNEIKYADILAGLQTKKVVENIVIEDRPMLTVTHVNQF